MPASPPRYDLAPARDAILGATVGVIEPGPLAPSPARRPAIPPSTEGGVEQYALWGALALAVIVLAGLALRLARHEGAAPPPPS